MPEETAYLLDVNVLVAILDKDHLHYQAATEWFDTPGIEWAICPFTEAGLLRHMTRPPTGVLTMAQATALLTRLEEEQGYFYLPVTADWQTLSRPFSQRIFGHNQITDAYLLGLAIAAGLMLVTFDRAILHLAGEHGNRVLLLQ